MASLLRIRRGLVSQQFKLLWFDSFSPRLVQPSPIPIPSVVSHLFRSEPEKNTWFFRNFSHGTVKFVISGGKPKFETHEIDPPKKEKWMTKKRLKLKRMRERKKRRAANSKDPRRLTVRGKKQRFANAEEKLKYKLEKARVKEALLVERLKRYEVPKLQGPMVKPHELTGEQRFYLKKMGLKGSNYVPVGRRGVFGGVILNMHMHWKKHETVKVFCKPCKPGQIHEYAQEIARLSGGVPIQIIGDDTIIFYRGKNYVQPEVMSPIDTLSKKKALEKSKYEQSLESARHFIAVTEKELELYRRHIALYGNRNSNSDPPSGGSGKTDANLYKAHNLAEDTEFSSTDQELDSSSESEQDDSRLSTDDEAYDFEDEDGNSCGSNET